MNGCSLWNGLSEDQRNLRGAAPSNFAICRTRVLWPVQQGTGREVYSGLGEQPRLVPLEVLLLVEDYGQTLIVSHWRLAGPWASGGASPLT